MRDGESSFLYRFDEDQMRSILYVSVDMPYHQSAYPVATRDHPRNRHYRKEETEANVEAKHVATWWESKSL